MAAILHGNNVAGQAFPGLGSLLLEATTFLVSSGASNNTKPTMSNMAAEKTSVPPTGKSRHDFVVLLLCLGAVLGLLFHPSFRSEKVLFSNDGPLGAAIAQADEVWDNLRGSWQELNWLGGKTPGGFLTAGYLTYAILG